MSHRTLVVHTGGIGDFLCALPALQCLGRETAIEIAGMPERVALAEAAGIAGAAHDLDHTGFPSVFTAPDDRLRDFARRFDRALVWMKDPDGAITRNLATAGIPEVRCVPGIPPSGWSRHAAYWYAEGARVPIVLPARFDFGPAPRSYDVILQPGSGSAAKNWPLEDFLHLAAALGKSGHAVTWCRGPAETALPVLAPVLPAMPLCELARTLAGSALFVGNDSGISHLASLAGCATVAVFGPTDPDVWQPAGARTTVVRGAPWPAWQDVFQAAISQMPPSRTNGNPS